MSRNKIHSNGFYLGVIAPLEKGETWSSAGDPGNPEIVVWREGRVARRYNREGLIPEPPQYPAPSVGDGVMVFFNNDVAPADVVSTYVIKEVSHDTLLWRPGSQNAPVWQVLAEVDRDEWPLGVELKRCMWLNVYWDRVWGCFRLHSVAGVA